MKPIKIEIEVIDDDKHSAANRILDALVDILTYPLESGQRELDKHVCGSVLELIKGLNGIQQLEYLRQIGFSEKES